MGPGQISPNHPSWVTPAQTGMQPGELGMSQQMKPVAESVYDLLARAANDLDAMHAGLSEWQGFDNSAPPSSQPASLTALASQVAGSAEVLRARLAEFRKTIGGASL